MDDLLKQHVKGENPCGFSPLYKADGSSGLTLGELEAGAGCFLAVLLTLLDARIAGYKTGLLQGPTHLHVGLQQGLGDTVLDSARLA